MSYLKHISRNPIVRIAYKGFNPPVYPFFVHPEPKYEDINLSFNSNNSLLNFPVCLYRKYERNTLKTKIMRIYISKENPANLSLTERFFEILTAIREPVFLEVIAMEDRINWYIIAQDMDTYLIKNAMKITNPNSVIEYVENDPVQEHYDQIKYSEKRESYRFNYWSYSPGSSFIRKYIELKDTRFNEGSFLFLLCNLFQSIPIKEGFIAYQLSLWPCKNDWGKLAAQLIKLSRSHNTLQKLHPNILRLLSPMAALNEREFYTTRYYSAHMRIIALCPKVESLYINYNSLQLLKSTGIDFLQYDRKYYISNVPDPYLAGEMIFTRNYLHDGFLIPIKEVAQLFHFPTEKMISDKMLRINCVSSSLPSESFKNSNGTVIGYSKELGEKIPISLSVDLKRHHTYIIGTTGSGKSVLLQNMIKCDLNNGQGVCVIDPHGDLARDVIGFIPENRIEDVIFFDPADEGVQIGFNILDLGLEKYEACNCLMDVFQSIFTDWSYRQLEIVRFCLLALLEKKDTTIKNILDILLNRMYREHLIIKLDDPLVKEWWQGYGRFSKDAANPISYKINMFCTTPLISNVINQPENKINIFDVLDKGKILIANLPKGKLGNEYSRLLGTLIVSLFQVAALKREKIIEKSRRDFTIYLDEFESFITPSIISILKEARKYRVNLVLAHQNMAESSLSKEMKGAILGNTGTKIIFRVASKDANLLSDELGKTKPEELVSLDQYNAIVKAFTDTFQINTNPPPNIDYEIANNVIELSRSRYTAQVKQQNQVKTETELCSDILYDEI